MDDALENEFGGVETVSKVTPEDPAQHVMFNRNEFFYLRWLSNYTSEDKSIHDAHENEPGGGGCII